MRLRLLIDMNLSAEWVEFLNRHGHEAVHWLDVGDPRAADSAIADWARTQRQIVFTHDLDFSQALALTRAAGPSILQIRSRHVLPERIGQIVLAALAQFAAELQRGAIVVVDERQNRVRILPLTDASTG